MSEQTRQQVTIAVDLKKYRIRIHRSTLALLGTPKYVQFLVSPSAMMLAIQGTDKKTAYTHRVNLAALHPDNSYEIYSTSFVNKLCSLVEGLDSAYALSSITLVHGGYDCLYLSACLCNRSQSFIFLYLLNFVLSCCLRCNHIHHSFRYQIYINAHNALYMKKEVAHTIYAQPPRTQTFNNQKNEKRGRPYEINRKICP